MGNDDDPLRKRILTEMIAVQLLASCFTPPKKLNTLTLPSGWSNDKIRNHHIWLSTRRISSLRQHTQWKDSPAFGHQARNNSAASLWPERDDSLSREAILAEQISFQRRLRRIEDRSDTKRRREGEPSREELKRRRLFASRHLRRLETFKSASSPEFSNGFYTPRTETSSPCGKVKQTNAFKVIRGLRRRKGRNNAHHWSLEPFMAPENHPVFIQPVKDCDMKRWGTFRSGSH